MSAGYSPTEVVRKVFITEPTASKAANTGSADYLGLLPGVRSCGGLTPAGRALAWDSTRLHGRAGAKAAGGPHGATEGDG